jgi:hypothetical protein
MLNTQPNVNNPDIRIKMLMDKVYKIELKLKEIAAQKKLMDMGIPTDEYNSVDELIVEVDFQIQKLNKYLLEVKFISWNRKYDLEYSLN